MNDVTKDLLEGQTTVDAETVDRAWARFCGAFGDGPDAPYPGMIAAFEIHYGQSFRDKTWRTEAACWAAAWSKATARAEAALAAPLPDTDGWINPNDKTQKQRLPHIGEKVLFCHAGVTYYGKHTGGSFHSFLHPRRWFNTWDCLWMYPPEAKDVQLAHILTAEHENDSRKAIQDLLAFESDIAVDPRVSGAASDLIEKARAEAIGNAADGLEDVISSVTCMIEWIKGGGDTKLVLKELRLLRGHLRAKVRK